MTEFRPPKATEIPKVAQWLRDTADHLTVYASGLLAASTLPPDVEGPAVHVSGGGPSDPTGNTATRDADFARESVLTVEQNNLRGYMADAVQVCDRLMATMGTLGSMLGPPKAPATDDDHQCEEGCGRPKAPGRKGRCERCYRWLYEAARKDPSGVPPLRVPTRLIREWRDRDAGKAQRTPAPGHVDHPTHPNEAA